MEKLTISNKFDAVINLLNGEESVLSVEDAVEFLEDRKAKSKRKAGTRKPTATQKENEVYKDLIVEKLSNSELPMTVTDIIKSVDELNGFNTQKISALTRQLVLAGKIKKEKDGKKTVFSIA